MLSAKVLGLKPRLVGPAAGVGALRVVFRLRHYPVKWSSRDVASVHHADAAERETGIGSTLPGVATVGALEYNAGLAAGSEQTFVAAIVGDRRDVLVG
jgi:hypothetical protein